MAETSDPASDLDLQRLKSMEAEYLKSQRRVRWIVIGAGLATTVAFGILAAIFVRMQTGLGPHDMYTRVNTSCSGSGWMIVAAWSFLIGLVAGPTLLVIGGRRESRLQDQSGTALVFAGIAALVLCVAALTFWFNLSREAVCD